MRLLLYLADRAGELVTIDELLDQVWSGTIVTQDSVYQAVTALRRLLGDDPKNPQYILTVPRKGYRLIAPVSPGKSDCTQAAASLPPPGQSSGLLRSRIVPVIAASLILLGAFGAMWLAQTEIFERPPQRAASSVEKSVAVMPFLDLTSESMSEEYVADGITEELIDALSKYPEVRVSPPTSSFYFKGRRASLADVARTLHVAYVLDGSLRRSGPTLRVAVRLVSARTGFVVWSNTYNRQTGDILKVQDEIAADVAKAFLTRV